MDWQNDGYEKMNQEAALEKAIADLAKLEPAMVCMKSGVIFNREQDSYILPCLNRRYLVRHSSGEAEELSRGGKAPLHLQLLFLHYLTCADGTPPGGKWVTIKDLPGGQNYAGVNRVKNIHPLLQNFGSKERPFHSTAVSLGAIPASLGSYSLLFHPFPKIPLIFVSWGNGERFSFAENILYDISAPHYLPIEDCALLPALIMQEMTT